MFTQSNGNIFERYLTTLFIFSITLWLISCSDAVDRASTPPPKAPVAPLAVTKTEPGLNEGEVNPNSIIVITFTADLDTGTFSSETAQLFKKTDTNNAIPSTVSFNNGIGKISSTNALDPLTQYVVMLSDSIKDINGRKLVRTYQWEFTTGNFDDISGPSASLASPDTVNPNPLNTDIVIDFSETVDPETVTISLDNSEIVKNGVAIKSLTVNYKLNSISVSGLALAAETEFTLVLSDTLADMAGNTLQGNSTWKFSTSKAPDVTAPQIVSTLPVNGSVALLRDTTFKITVSEALNNASVSANTVLLQSATDDSIVNVRVNYGNNDNTITVTPLTPLLFSRIYFISLNGLSDTAGNLLDAPELKFSTELDDDKDGMPNRWEQTFGDLIADQDIETDAMGNIVGDGLNNLDEFDLGSDPLNMDTDGDGQKDGDEVLAGRNPTVNEPVVLGIINNLLLDD